MKRYYTSLLLWAIVSFTLSGCSQNTPPKARELPGDLTQKISFSIDQKMGGVTFLTYNGSDWTVSDFDVEIIDIKKNKTLKYRVFMEEPANRIDRTPSSALPLRPFSFGIYTLQVAYWDFFPNEYIKADWSYKIVSARGYRD